MYVYTTRTYIFTVFLKCEERHFNISYFRNTLPTGSNTLLNSMQLGQSQRIPNDLKRTRLSCGRMIRLIAHPLPPSPVSNMSLFLGLSVCRRSSLLTGEGGGGGQGAKSYDREETGPSISFNTLWVVLRQKK
jgi:hypothetical protein